MRREEKEKERRPLPLWMIGIFVVVALALAVFTFVRTVAEPPPASSFNERPLEERKAAVEQMLKARGTRPGPPRSENRSAPTLQ